MSAMSQWDLDFFDEFFSEEFNQKCAPGAEFSASTPSLLCSLIVAAPAQEKDTKTSRALQAAFCEGVVINVVTLSGISVLVHLACVNRMFRSAVSKVESVLYNRFLTSAFGAHHRSVPLLPLSHWAREGEPEAAQYVRWARWIWFEAGRQDSARRPLSSQVHSPLANCFVCAKSRCTGWVCTRTAISMCIDCASRTRDCGVHVVKLKHVRMDRWTPREIFRLAMGGNRRAIIFLLPHLPINYSYSEIDQIGLGKFFDDLTNLFTSILITKYREELTQREKLVTQWAGILNNSDNILQFQKQI